MSTKKPDPDFAAFHAQRLLDQVSCTAVKPHRGKDAMCNISLGDVEWLRDFIRSLERAAREKNRV